ncbi:hypothetical protein C8F01DRAFT_270639 [Mycena amicta]|nr:hypothetical protein C8F01DRAFT_270639 [Mycena amicta]
MDDIRQHCRCISCRNAPFLRIRRLARTATLRPARHKTTQCSAVTVSTSAPPPSQLSKFFSAQAHSPQLPEGGVANRVLRGGYHPPWRIPWCGSDCNWYLSPPEYGSCTSHMREDKLPAASSRDGKRKQSAFFSTRSSRVTVTSPTTSALRTSSHKGYPPIETSSGSILPTSSYMAIFARRGPVKSTWWKRLATISSSKDSDENTGATVSRHSDAHAIETPGVRCSLHDAENLFRGWELFLSFPRFRAYCYHIPPSCCSADDHSIL